MIAQIAAYEPGKNRRKDFLFFFLAFVAFFAYGFFYHARFGWYRADSYVTTLLAFSYLDNGFFRRGLTGTIFGIVCKIIPAAQTFRGAYWFMWGTNFVYFTSLILFVRWIFGKIKDEKVYKGLYNFALICFVFLIPTACYQAGAFGRADLFQMAICLLQVYLLVEKKCEWLTLPLTAVNVLFHEGYVLMTFCSVLIVLLYRALHTEGSRGKYWLLFGLNIAVCGVFSVLSLKGGSQVGSPESLEKAYILAKQLNGAGNVHYNLLYMMAGYQPENALVIDDSVFVANEAAELPIFLVCFIPVFLVFGRAIINLLRKAKGKEVLFALVAVLLGPALIAVEYWKYCDYGRYIVWIVFYYFVMLLSFAAMGDEDAKETLRISFGYKTLTMLLLIVLMLIYQPLPTCSFTQISSEILLQMQQ